MHHCRQCGASLGPGVREEHCLACAGLDLIAEHEPSPFPHDSAKAGRVGEYQLLEEIARGGMGVVFRARQSRLDRIVALKMIREGAWANLALRQRFLTEARAAARLRHPHIVTLHEIGEHRGMPFFSMDFIDGPNLAQCVSDQAAPPELAAKLLATIAEAVHFAHTHGILHRDLKPQNILLDAAGQPYVADFGLAHDMGQERGLTLTGQLLGSPAFMSPEQADGRQERLQPASDVYSLGGILYYLLTARAPFESPSLPDLLSKIRDEEPVAPRRINRVVPPDLETICLKCLRKNPRDRYETAQELAAELGRFLRHEAILARPLSSPERAWRWCQRRPALAVLSGIATIAASAALIGTIVASRRSDEVRRVETQHRAARAERLLVDARHLRQSGHAGQQSFAMSLLREARALNDSPEFLARLRDEAIASLVVPEVTFEPVNWFGATNRIALRPGELAFSRDLKTCAAWEGNQVVVRRASDGFELGRVEGKISSSSTNDSGLRLRIREVSPSGRFLALEDRANRRAAVWDVRQRPPAPVAMMTNRCAGFAGFLKEEGYVALAGYDGSLGVFDVESGERDELGIMSWAMRKSTSWAPFWRVRQLALGSDGRHGLVSIRDYTAGERPLLALFDLPAEMLLRRFEMEFHAQDLALNPSGDLIIAVASEQRTDVLDALSGRRLIALNEGCLQPGVGKDAHTLGLFWRGNRLVEARLQGTRFCREWRHTWEAMNYLWSDGFTAGGIEALTFSTDGRFLAAAYPPRIGFWDSSANQFAGWLPANDGARPYFHPRSTSLFLVGSNRITRWNMVPDQNRNAVRCEMSHQKTNDDVWGEATIDARGEILAVAQPQRNRVLLLDAATLDVRRAIEPLTNVSALALSGDGRLLATAARDENEVRLWRTESGESFATVAASKRTPFALSFDARWLAVAADETYEIYATDSRERIARVPMRLGQNTKRRALAFSPDNRYLAVLLGESDVALVDTHNWRVSATLPPRTPSAFNTLRFNGDGTLLAAGGEGGRVCVWDLPGLDRGLADLHLTAGLSYPKDPAAECDMKPLLLQQADFPFPTFPIEYPTNGAGLVLPGDYNLRREFSITRNPANVWSYGWKREPTSPFNLFRIPRRDLRDLDGRGDYQNFSWCEEVGREPAVIYHPGPQTWVYPGRDDETGELRIWNIEPACVTLIPPAGERYRENAWTGVRFTAPHQGQYEWRLRAKLLPVFKRVHDTTRAQLIVLHGTTNVAGHVLSPGESVALARTVLLQAEEVVEFLFQGQPLPEAKEEPAVQLDIEVYRR